MLPTRRIASSVSVAGPGQDGDDRPPRQHRHLRRRAANSTTVCAARTLRLDTGEALHQRDIAECIGRGLGEVGILAFDGALQRTDLSITRP